MVVTSVEGSLCVVMLMPSHAFVVISGKRCSCPVLGFSVTDREAAVLRVGRQGAEFGQRVGRRGEVGVGGVGGTELVRQLSRCECLQVWVLGQHCQKCLVGVSKEGRQTEK